MKRGSSIYDAVLVGGGPAGLGFIVSWLLSDRRVSPSGRLMAIEQSAAIGAGRIGQYQIPSDSLAESFIKCAEKAITLRPDLLEEPSIQSVMKRKGEPISLSLAGNMLSTVGLGIAGLNDFDLATRSTALRAIRKPEGLWNIHYADHEGQTQQVAAKNLVIATGAVPRRSNEAFGFSYSEAGQEVIHSDDVISASTKFQFCLDAPEKYLRAPVVIGGSHSAMSAAIILSDLIKQHDYRGAKVTVLHRRPLVPMYLGPAEARADGFDKFQPEDICKTTGRVFPLAGFRTASREFVRQQLALGGLSPNPNVDLINTSEVPKELPQRLLAGATLIVDATGYKPRLLPLIGTSGEPIELAARDELGRNAAVDDKSRLVTRAGEVLPNAYALGLSVGYDLKGKFGEESFRGEANGLSLWFDHISDEIIRQIRPQ